MVVSASSLAGSLPTIDFTTAEFATDPFAASDAARGSGWLATSVRGYEVLSRSVADRLLVDRDHLDGIGAAYYRAQDASELICDYAANGMLPLITWNRHDPIRRALHAGFAAKGIRGLRDDMRAVADGLIDRNAAGGGIDVVAGFTDRYPIEVVCRLLGLPVEDIPGFVDWTVSLARLSHNPVGPHVAEIDDALAGLYGYFEELVARRRVDPGDDFVSTFVQIADEGGDEALTRLEMFGALVNLLFAGHDTTRLETAWAIHLLLTDRHQWRLLCDDASLVKGAVHETLRYAPALQTILRVVTDEFTVDDVTFAAGETLSINIPAVNRDPHAVDEPGVYDVARGDPSLHLTFGRGHRLCLGHMLATTEMSVALEAFTERFPDADFARPTAMSDAAAATYGPESVYLALVG